MLNRIHIKDLAIVSAQELELRPGMTVLTGETGAGKSILIDALGLALGDRADSGMIRAGCERAEITADFDLSALPAVRALLEGQEIDSGECILRRVVLANGGSRAYLNGSPAPARLLQQLGEMLVDIHGQHAHQSLLQRDQQRVLLDEYAGHRGLLDQVARQFRDWQAAARRLQELRDASRERSDRLDLLRFQVEELTALRLTREELPELDEEHRRLSNAGQLLEGCSRLLGLLDDGEVAARALLSEAAGEMDHLAVTDPALEEGRGLLENAGIQLEEAVRLLRHYADGLELDPARLGEVEQRIAEIQDMARKYRCPPAELPNRLEQLEQERRQLENADIHLANLETQTGQLAQAYRQAAEVLEQSRREAAHRLQREVSEGMQGLGMPGGRLEIRLERLPEEKAAAHGWNRVELLVSANPGQPVQPLAKVASGGELSRISLAIQVATAGCTGTPTLIFDEVDVGIGGRVAEIVGQRLRRLGQSRQVLCVTHLPQVAAQGHHHLRVSKQSTEGDTLTRIEALSEGERVEELARMMGGVQITEQTRAHAREMLEHAQREA